jgi:hypothetical protein
MASLFESSRLKIGRAQHHIRDLDGQITRFFDEYPHEVVIEADVEPGYKIYKARLTHAIPISLALVASDAIANLRAALDHVGYSIALAMGIEKPKSYYFPFANTADSFATDKRVRDRCRKLPDQVVACFNSFQPYMDGNTFLWALNEMCNRDKHAVVTPICIANHSIYIRYAGSIERPPNRRWDDAKNEIELFRAKGEPKYDLRLALDVGFDGPEPLQREPMIETLNTFVSIVEDILMCVERECRLLGIV